MTAAVLADFILAIFKSYRDNSKIIEQLLTDDIIHPSFEKRYVLNNIDFDFKLTAAVAGSKNIAEYYLESGDGSPYKMELIFEGRWYLRSFLFQCQGCLGDDDQCPVCGGAGWGVL